MSLKSSLMEKLNQLGVSPKRSLGQNFLISEHVIDKIVRKALSYEPQQLVEIGPGLGALTDHLRAHSDFTVVEMDQKFSQYWRDQGVNVVESDALKVDWYKLIHANSVLVSNLPYQIGASIVIERSVGPKPVKAMVLMFQKEVAQRVTADHGNKTYGLLTVVAQAFWKVQKLVDAGPGDFYPPPNVASRVVSFERRQNNIEEPQKFVNFVKAAFAQRRKLLVKNLKAKYSEDSIKSSLKKLEIDLGVRAEQISVNEYIELYQLLEQ